MFFRKEICSYYVQMINIMRIKRVKITALAIGCVLGSALLFSGCGSILDEIGITGHSEDAVIEEELEQGTATSTADGTIRLTSHWFDQDGEKLINATVTITADGTEVYTGTTDENGILPACTFPSNQKITYTVKDASGAVLGSSEAAYIVSGDFSVITIYTRNADSNTQKIEIPSGKTDIVAAMFIDSNQKIGHSNITINRATSAEQAETVDAEATADATEEAPAEEATEETVEETETEESTEDTSDEETAEEETTEEDGGEEAAE